MRTKQCAKCKVVHQLTDFARLERDGVLYRRRWCEECIAKFIEEQREEVSKWRRKDSRIYP